MTSIPISMPMQRINLTLPILSSAMVGSSAVANDEIGVLYILFRFADDQRSDWLLTYSLHQHQIINNVSYPTDSVKMRGLWLQDVFFSARRNALYSIIMCSVFLVNVTEPLMSIDHIDWVDPVTGQAKSITPPGQKYPIVANFEEFIIAFDDETGDLWIAMGAPAVDSMQAQLYSVNIDTGLVSAVRQMQRETILTRMLQLYVVR